MGCGSHRTLLAPRLCVLQVTIITRHTQDELLLLASDGLWDVMNNQEACTLAKKCLQRARQRGASRAVSHPGCLAWLLGWGSVGRHHCWHHCLTTPRRLPCASVS